MGEHRYVRAVSWRPVSVLAGDFVTKLPPIVAAAISRPHSLVLTAVFAVTFFTGADAQAAIPAAAYCQQIKTIAARQPCFDALKTASDGNIPLSLTMMRMAVAAAPKEGVVRMLLAMTLLRADNPAAAERELRQARKDGAPDRAVLPALFQALMARHKENQLLAEFPDPAPNMADEVTAQILRGRALALQSLDRIDEAAAAMDRSLSLQRDPAALLERAKMAAQQNDPALADKLTDETLRLDPKNGAALVAKLERLSRSNDAAKTLAFSDQVLKLYPDNIDARRVRIDIFLKLKQEGKAKAEVDNILARSPNHPVGRYYQAVLLARANDKKAAWQIILALPPEFVKSYPEYAVSMAQFAVDNGSVDTAAGILGYALGAAPRRAEVRLRLAELRMGQNSPQSAMLLLAPIENSPDPRVQKLLSQVRGAIAKNRAF
jgi:predicted Zn-dependent protease